MLNVQKEIVMYSRTSGCPFVSLAKRVFTEHNIDYREVYIDEDDMLRQRVLDWTGFLSVPTLIIAAPGEDVPIEAPQNLRKGKSPRGVNRGSMITEPGTQQLKIWLKQHGFINQEQAV